MPSTTESIQMKWGVGTPSCSPHANIGYMQIFPILYKGCELQRILVSEGDPGTNPQQTPRDNWIQKYEQGNRHISCDSKVLQWEGTVPLNKSRKPFLYKKSWGPFYEDDTCPSQSQSQSKSFKAERAVLKDVHSHKKRRSTCHPPSDGQRH